MRKPVPPATFKTTVPVVRTDLERLRDHCGDILKWIDAESSGGGGIGTITELESSNGSLVITNPTGPTVDLTVDPDAFVSTDFANYPLDASPGLTDRVVTNDSADPTPYRLKYATIGTLPVAGQANGTLAATKVTGITESAGPTALTIGAVANGELLRRVGSTVVGIPTTSIPSTIPAYLQHIWLKPPTVANAWDDEFESGSADLATRGWTITSGVTVLTRAGDIQPTGSVPANQYRSTIVGSCICIQLPAGGSCAVSKAIATIAMDDKYYCRFGTSSPLYGGSTGNFSGFSLAYSSGGLPDFNNRYLTSQSWDNGVAGMNIAIGRALGGSYTTQAIQPRVHADIHGWRCAVSSTATNLFGEVGYSGNMQTMTTYGHAGSGTFPVRNSLAIAAVEYAHLTSASNLQPAMFWIDFFRKKTGSDWLIST